MSDNTTEMSDKQAQFHTIGSRISKGFEIAQTGFASSVTEKSSKESHQLVQNASLYSLQLTKIKTTHFSKSGKTFAHLELLLAPSTSDSKQVDVMNSTLAPILSEEDPLMASEHLGALIHHSLIKGLENRFCETVVTRSCGASDTRKSWFKLKPSGLGLSTSATAPFVALKIEATLTHCETGPSRQLRRRHEERDSEIYQDSPAAGGRSSGNVRSRSDGIQ